MRLKSYRSLGGMVLVIGLLGLTSWRWLQPAPAQEVAAPPIQQQAAGKENPRLELQKRKLEIAKRSYEELENRIRTGRSIAGTELEWSRHWLECERELYPKQSLAAAQAHRERVKKGYDMAKTRFDIGNMPQYEFSAYDYALAEADLWLLREKEKR